MGVKAKSAFGEGEGLLAGGTAGFGLGFEGLLGFEGGLTVPTGGGPFCWLGLGFPGGLTGRGGLPAVTADTVGITWAGDAAAVEGGDGAGGFEVTGGGLCPGGRMTLDVTVAVMKFGPSAVGMLVMYWAGSIVQPASASSCGKSGASESKPAENARFAVPKK